MTTRIQALNHVTKKKLVQVATQLGYKGWAVLTKDIIVERLANDRSISKQDLLRMLEPEQLEFDQVGKAGKPSAKKKLPAKKDLRPKRSKKVIKRKAKMRENNNRIAELEKRLWDAADQLRANSSLTAQEYSRPVLGLIFLKYADHRFSEAEKDFTGNTTGRRRRIGKLDYQDKGVMYLPDKARYSKLITLPEGADIGGAINQAMELIEAENEDLRGVLPRTYNRLENTLLFELLKLFNSS